MADEPIRKKQSKEENKEKKDRGPWAKRLLLTGAILLVIGLEVGLSYILNKRMVVPKYFSSTSGEVKKQSDEMMAEGNIEDKAGLNTNIFLLENIVINPRGTNGLRYVAMAIGMGVNKASTLEVLRGREIQIRDTMNTLLADKPLGEFVDMERREKLKREILAAVNEKIEPFEVESIYFKEYVIQ